ncbi:MAG: competence/damage-inducible protein A [Gammaproteobacteria bacterium]|nr:competence/damage-inducible protein A [Gammaproteobacteria bacterium]
MSETGERVYTAAVLVIGNEVLSGRIQDANIHFLANAFRALGIRLREARVVPDVDRAIIDAVNELRARHDYVMTTGGIGPTHDDITAECVARAFGVTLERNAEALAILEDYYGDDINEARMRMANIPAGATLLDNPVSRAPGFQIGNVFVLPGVPRIMQAMFDGFRHRLAGGRPLLSRTVTAFIPESYAAAGLADIQARHPEAEIGSYPHFRQRRFGTSLVVRGTDPAVLAAATEEVVALVRALGEEPEVSEGEGPPGA